MRRSQRVIAASVAIVLSSALAGCAGGMSSFDPSDLLDFLDTKKKLPGERKPVDRAGLERNARLLESVLEDFHVRGDIVEVRPGPVVTMYELEPASGIKASRVIQLADDIQAWVLGADGTWHKDDQGGRVDSHRRLQELALAQRRPS